MTNISRYLVNVGLHCVTTLHLHPFHQERDGFPHFTILSLPPRLQHLLTFSLQDGDVQGVEEAQARLSFLAQSKKLWSQQMFLVIGAEAVHLQDVQTQVRTDA